MAAASLSLTMTASFLTSTSSISSCTRRATMIVKASSNSNEEAKPNMVMSVKKNDGNGRRELVFAAAAAAAVYSITNIGDAMADDEPKRGTPEAKKKYGPVCVTMPTARICRN